MNVGQTFLIADVAIGLGCASSVAVIVIARFRRRVAVRITAMLAPYRQVLVAMAAGEDEDGQAKAARCAVAPRVWARLRASVIPKVRGAPAENLGDLLRGRCRGDERACAVRNRPGGPCSGEASPTTILLGPC